MPTSTRGIEAEGEGEDLFRGALYKGGELLAAGNIVEARDHLEKAHELAPKDEKAQNLLGLAYFKLGLFDRASAVYEKLVNENPSDATLRVNLGLVFLKTNNLDRCIREFEAATDLEPDHRKAHNYLGLALAQQGTYAKAKVHFELAGSDQMAEKMARAVAASTSVSALSGIRSPAGQALEPTVSTEAAPAQPPAVVEEPIEVMTEAGVSSDTDFSSVVPATVEELPVLDAVVETVSTDESSSAAPEWLTMEAAEATHVEMTWVTENVAGVPLQEDVPLEAPLETIEVSSETVSIETTPLVEGVAPSPAATSDLWNEQAPIPVDNHAWVESPDEVATHSTQAGNEAATSSVPSDAIWLSSDTQTQWAVPTGIEAPAADPYQGWETASTDVPQPPPSAPLAITVEEPQPAPESLAAPVIESPSAGYAPLASKRLVDLGASGHWSEHPHTGTFQHSAEGLAVSVAGEMLVRMTDLVAVVGHVTVKPEHRRRRGRPTAEPFGLGPRQLQRVTGHGVIYLEPQRATFHAIDLTDQNGTSIDDDGAYLREELVFGFEEPVGFENGRMMSEEFTLDLVHLKGTGQVLLELDGPLRTMVIPLGAPLVVPLSRLVGWFGRVNPRLVGFGGQGAMELTGEGYVLMGAALGKG
jgi:Flp pilus assembly protein TadD